MGCIAWTGVDRTHAHITALERLEWSLPDEDDLDHLRAVKRANPAPWISVADLRRQRAAVPEAAFTQFHACRWGVDEGSWLAAGAWQARVVGADRDRQLVAQLPGPTLAVLRLRSRWARAPWKRSPLPR
jgi:hypothetical protein